MKVAFFEPYIGTTKLIGGAQKVMFYLSEGLKSFQVEETIIFTGIGRLFEKAIEYGLNAKVIPAPRILNLFDKKLLQLDFTDYLFSYLPAFLSYNVKLARSLREYGIDVLILNTTRALFMGGLAPFFARIPSILYIHGYPPMSMNVIQSTFMDAFASFIPDRIITVSQDLQSGIMKSRFYFMRHGKMLTVYNGIDMTSFAISKQRNLHEIQQMPIIGCVATVILTKGIHILIEAFAKVKQHYPKAKLLVAGQIRDNDYFDYLNSLIENLGLRNDDILFLGWVDNIKSFLNDIDIFVLPSFTEGLPMSVIEAAVSGVPVVATNVGGIPEIVEDEASALLVEPEDSTQISKAIIRLLNEPGLIENLRKTAIEAVRHRFCIENQVAKVYEICKTISKKGKIEMEDEDEVY